MSLRENYKDDILDLSENVNRKYNMVTNDDDTVSLEDVTVYSQEGDTFGASDINATNHVVNELDNAVSNIDLRVDSVSGKPQWKERGADTWQNFSNIKDALHEALGDVFTITLYTYSSMVKQPGYSSNAYGGVTLTDAYIIPLLTSNGYSVSYQYSKSTGGGNNQSGSYSQYNSSTNQITAYTNDSNYSTQATLVITFTWVG